MKIKISDAQHVINQIKRASPPTTKEMHKLINNLGILLERNTEKQPSPSEPLLSGKLEEQGEAFQELCFLRRELVRKYANEYASQMARTLERIEANRKRLTGMPGVERIDWSREEISRPGEEDDKELISYVFGKLKKGKGVIEDAIKNRTKEDKREADGDVYLEAYVNGRM